jgi:hypothetical protein
VQWFIEGDIHQCFDSLDPTVLLSILREKLHDHRFLRLMANLFKAGYLEEWTSHPTLSGVPQGGVCSPILMNIYLDRLDQFVETGLLPSDNRGDQRKRYQPYRALLNAARRRTAAGQRDQAKRLRQHAQRMPSRDPADPNFRRLWYVRYADETLLGCSGPRAEAEEIKGQLTAFLRDTLKLERSQEKTLITHARTHAARFLGYDVVTLDADDKHDHRGQRCINGAIGLRVPATVLTTHCAKYTQAGRPRPLLQRLHDSAYSIVAQYQTEYQGVVQYYRMAYNLHQLQKLKRVMETSLTRTLAKKFKTSRTQIYRRFRALHHTEHGTYKVREVRVERGPTRAPLVARFGGIPLRWNRWAKISAAPTKPIWSGRSEVVERLLADTCELCGATDHIEVHHIRKLKDLDRAGQPSTPRWAKVMATRRRKTLVVCQACHHHIQYGRYDGPALSPKSHWRAG